LQKKDYLQLALKKITFTVILKHVKNDGIAEYVPKETVLKEIAANNEYLTQQFFIHLVQEGHAVA
jgi:hypothetical protein